MQLSTDINITNKFISKIDPNQTNKFNSIKLNNYDKYLNNTIKLTTFKVPELKLLAKNNNIKVTGTKPILIERIKTYFNKSLKAVKIQACFRGWFFRNSIKLRGPGFKNRKLCVNDNDFVTLEPINEISYENFYSYTDSKNFVYGFDIGSLIMSIKQKGKLENPYNREKITNPIIEDIKKLYRSCFIIFPNFKDDHEKITTILPNNRTSMANNRQRTVYNTEQQSRIRNLIENRNLSVSQRITNLFLEIDQLGNYTQTEWFTSLNNAAVYSRLYRNLYDVWFLRSQIPRETRFNICPYNPFSNENSMNSSMMFHNNVLDLERIKIACVEVFENMVFTGIDDEHRRLGTFHALTALTLVSPRAREAMPWLYESVAVF
jgi:hypothetical protein